MPYNSQPSIDPGNKFSRGDGKIQFSLNLYPKSIYILSRGNQIPRVYEQAINLPQPQPLVLPFVDTHPPGSRLIHSFPTTNHQTASVLVSLALYITRTWESRGFTSHHQPIQPSRLFGDQRNVLSFVYWTPALCPLIPAFTFSVAHFNTKIKKLH